MFLTACQSDRVILLSEFRSPDGQAYSYVHGVAKNYDVNFEMDEIVKGASKFCFGVPWNYPVYFCGKDDRIIVLSFYKNYDGKLPTNIEQFLKIKKNKYEKESLRIHNKLESDFESKVGKRNVRFIDKSELGKIIEKFINE